MNNKEIAESLLLTNQPIKSQQIYCTLVILCYGATVKSEVVHQWRTHFGLIKFNLQSLLSLWLFPGSSSQHHGPGRQRRNHQASQNPPPLVPGGRENTVSSEMSPWNTRQRGQTTRESSTNQVFICFALKGELPPHDESDLGEDVALQQVLKQHLARFSRGAKDEAAFILLPEVFLQSLHVLSHPAGQNTLTAL